jgi:hypothetical protein
LGENIAIKMFLYMKMRLGVWRRGGKLSRGITVPVQEEDEQAAAGSREDNGAGGAAPGGDKGGVPALSASEQAEGGGRQEEKDRFKTLPRNRSIKRSSGGH